MIRRVPRIAIIGGIAGLAAALALHRRGVEVAAYEQAPDLSEIGAGAQMTPNGAAHRVAWLYGYDVAAKEHYA
jgi:salicylate hydroxylase